MGGERTRRGIPGCLWKGPLGCLGFSLGLGVVLSALLPFACGAVGERALEARFDRLHQGSLSIEEARLGALFGKQGFWGVTLRGPDGAQVLRGDLEFPSVEALVQSGEAAGPAQVDVWELELRAVRGVDGAWTTNLQRALASKARAYAGEGGPSGAPPPSASGTVPRSSASAPDPGSEAGTPEADAAPAAGGAPVGPRVRISGDDASVRFDVDGDSLSLGGVDHLEVEGAVHALRWVGEDGLLALSGADLDLAGSLRSVDGEAHVELVLEGTLCAPPPSGACARLRVQVRYESSGGGEFTARPTGLVVELAGEAGNPALDPALTAHVARAVELLGSGRLRRDGVAARWTLLP